MVPRVVCRSLLLSLIAASASAMEISSPCGVLVPRGETATLSADVDCSATSPLGNAGSIALEPDARLELNGHTIRLVGSGPAAPIDCPGRCTVVGPGRITTDLVGTAVSSFGRGPIRIQDVTIDNLIVGVFTPFARLELTNVDIDAKAIGIVGKRITLTDVSVNLMFPDGGDCIEAQSSGWVRGSGVSLTNCHQFAISGGRKVQLSGLTSVGGIVGVRARHVVLTDSSVSGTTYPGGMDVLSARPPILSNTTCGRSGRLTNDWVINPPPTWGVCSGD